jgi:putative (di)nucleoside polyphosphate hydrolase
MVANTSGQIWIGRRSGSPNQDPPAGWWQMPQGGIDADEDPAQAAVRELYEETGIRSARIIAESPEWYPYDLPPELLGRVWGGRYRGQRQKWFALRFTGEDSEINIAPHDGHDAEFDAWRWADPNELLDLIVPFKRDVYVQVLRDLVPRIR